MNSDAGTGQQMSLINQQPRLFLPSIIVILPKNDYFCLHFLLTRPSKARG